MSEASQAQGCESLDISRNSDDIGIIAAQNLLMESTLIEQCQL